MFLLIAFTYLHRSSREYPATHLLILSSYLFSPISFLFHPFHDQKKNDGKPRLVERFGSIAFPFRQVFILTSFTVINSSYNKSVSPILIIFSSLFLLIFILCSYLYSIRNSHPLFHLPYLILYTLIIFSISPTLFLLISFIDPHLDCRIII